jgi:hypothetical protein
MKTLTIVRSIEHATLVDCGSVLLRKGTILVKNNDSIIGFIMYNERDDTWEMFLNGEFVTSTDEFIEFFEPEYAQYTYQLSIQN